MGRNFCKKKPMGWAGLTRFFDGRPWNIMGCLCEKKMEKSDLNQFFMKFPAPENLIGRERESKIT
jgi:hypothetical protein